MDCAYMKELKRMDFYPNSTDRSSTGTIEVSLKIPCIQIRFLWPTLLAGGTGHLASKKSVNNNQEKETVDSRHVCYLNI